MAIYYKAAIPEAFLPWNEKLELAWETAEDASFISILYGLPRVPHPAQPVQPANIAEIIDADTPAGTDGISFLPTLQGNEKEQDLHEYLYWEFHELNGRRAILKDNWKLINYNVFNASAATTELYNLVDDPGEQNNLALQHPDLVGELTRLMLSARTESGVFPFE